MTQLAKDRGAPNFALLRELYALLKTVPKEQIHLDEIKKDGDHACGTICCSIGWAASLPAFIEAGVVTAWNTEYPANTNDPRISCFMDNDGQLRGAYDVAQQMFNLSLSESFYLFCPYGQTRGDQLNADHKVAALARIERFFAQHYETL